MGSERRNVHSHIPTEGTANSLYAALISKDTRKNCPNGKLYQYSVEGALVNSIKILKIKKYRVERK